MELIKTRNGLLCKAIGQCCTKQSFHQLVPIILCKIASVAHKQPCREAKGATVVLQLTLSAMAYSEIGVNSNTEHLHLHVKD